VRFQGAGRDRFVSITFKNLPRRPDNPLVDGPVGSGERVWFTLLAGLQGFQAKNCFGASDANTLRRCIDQSIPGFSIGFFPEAISHNMDKAPPGFSGGAAFSANNSARRKKTAHGYRPSLHPAPNSSPEHPENLHGPLNPAISSGHVEKKALLWMQCASGQQAKGKAA
jgi:hypothetical protein